MMNLTNADEVLYYNKTPEYVQVGPYIVQENQEFMNPQYENLPNSNLQIVKYKWREYFTEFKGSKSLSDEITTLNLGSLGAWYQMGSSNISKIALIAAGQTNCWQDFRII